MSEKLEPCAHCGGTPFLHENDWCEPPEFDVCCENMECGASALACTDKATAITAWNRRAVERPADTMPGAEKNALEWLQGFAPYKHVDTIKAMLKQPADPRGWREAIEAAAGICDGYSLGTYEHTCHVEFKQAAAQIRSLSPAPKDREGKQDD